MGSATLLALLLGGVAKGSAHTRPPTAEGGIPVGRPSSDGPIVVAVVLGRSGTDDADALAPYEVFARSAKFSVYTVAASHEPATMNGGLHVVPTYDFADIANGVARKPDLVVVPAVNDPSGEQEAELRTWLVQQAHAGARILGICAGSRLLAATGIARRAPGHLALVPHRPPAEVEPPRDLGGGPALRRRRSDHHLRRRLLRHPGLTARHAEAGRHRGGGQGLPAGPLPRLDGGRVDRDPRPALRPQRRRRRPGRRHALVPAHPGRRPRRR